MNGAHDLGGMHGFGPIVPEADEPVFHAEWERRAFAFTLAAGALGRWNIDMSRFARERTDPADYLRSSYYEHWLHGLEILLVEQGLVTAEEMSDLTARSPAPPGTAVPPERMAAIIRRGGSARRDGDGSVEAGPARFAIGQAVRARNMHPTGHTRIPRYVRGRLGTIALDHGVFVFPDTHASGLGEAPQRCYSVRFAASTLWGPDAPEGDCVHVDLWDDYLDPA
ncbi:MAG: nitrile hydratase subunit beta [Alphaproteobacteria bacterium]